jgi:hypothetical protein
MTDLMMCTSVGELPGRAARASVSWASFGGPLFDLFSSRRYSASHRVRRIKLSLDPGNHAEHSMSAGPKEVPVARAWPLIMRFLFATLGALVLRSITKKAARMNL